MVKNISIGVLVVLVGVGFGLYLNKPVNLGASSGTEHYNLENFYSGFTIGGVNNTPISARSCSTATYNPPSLAANATTSVDVATPGVALGDTVGASFSLTTAGVSLLPYVSATGTTTVALVNAGFGTQDLATGTLKVCYTH